MARIVKKSEYVERSSADSIKKCVVVSRALAIRRYSARLKQHPNDLDLPTKTRKLEDVLAYLTVRSLNYERDGGSTFD